MSTTRKQKLLLIWKNHEGKSRYYRLQPTGEDSVYASLRVANGNYLSNGGQVTDEEKMAIQNVFAYLKDSPDAAPVPESGLSGFMGWDRIYVTGINGI